MPRLLRLSAVGILAMLAFLSLGVPSQSVLANSSAQLVLTPMGWFPKPCVVGVGTGALLLENGTAVLANGTRFSPPSSCDGRSARVPFPTNSWVEEAYYQYTTRPLTGMYGQWPVPSAPSSNDQQTIFLWIGLECCNAPYTGGYGVLQPVLQWGAAADGGGAYWIMTSWYVTSSGAAFYSTPISVSAGDTVVGDIGRGTCGIGCTTWRWSIISEDLRTMQSTTETIAISNTETSAYVNLEVYNVIKCADYPASGSTAFGSLQLTDTNGAITPSWLRYVFQNDGCGEGVTINSASSVTLSY